MGWVEPISLFLTVCLPSRTLLGDLGSLEWRPLRALPRERRPKGRARDHRRPGSIEKLAMSGEGQQRGKRRGLRNGAQSAALWMLDPWFAGSAHRETSF